MVVVRGEFPSVAASERTAVMLPAAATVLPGEEVLLPVPGVAMFLPRYGLRAVLVRWRGRVPPIPEAFLMSPRLVLPPGWLLMVLGCPASAVVTPVKVSGVGFNVSGKGRVPTTPEAFLVPPGLVLPPGWLLMVLGCPAPALVTPVKVSGVGFDVSGKGRVPPVPEAFLASPVSVIPAG